tara:strand:- start:3939 stop:4247 length:309 start_codon:yes stop_codon:yes gene_type:complete
MALGSKTSERIHGKTGGDKAKLQTNYDEGHLNTFVDLADHGQPEFGALMLQIEKMQDDIDELRRYVISNEVLATPGVGGALPTRASRNSGDLWNDRGIVKVV